MGKKLKPLKQMIVCIAVILLIIFAFWEFTQENEQRVTKQNMEYIQDSTVQMAGQIDDVLSEGYDNIRIMSDFLSQSLDKPEVDIELVRKITQDSVFDFIEFADEDGMDHNITGGVSDARDRQYYLDGIKGNTGLEVIFNSRATRETLLMFYSPVTFKEKIVGVLIGVYQADNKLAELLKTAYFGEPATLYLCMPDGRVVASNLHLDTNANLNITDLAGDDEELAGNMCRTLETGESLEFAFGEKNASGCMMRMNKSGWFLIQIFPEAANVSMVRDANAAGVKLEIILLSVFAVVFLLLIHSYRKDRKNIEDIAEERGKYKNAVLADAIIVFEANLTKNRIWEGAWKGKSGEAVPIEDVLGISLPCEYDTYIVKWAEAYVDKNWRKLFLEKTSRNYLNRLFEQGKSENTFEYYAKSLDGETTFVRRSIYLAADKKSGDVIAYSNVKDITEQKKKENQLYLYEQMLITTAAGMYRGVRQVDLRDLSVIYYSFEDNHIAIRDKGNWNAWLAEQEHYVHPDDVEKLKKDLSGQNFRQMPVGGSIQCSFRSKRKNEAGIHRVYFSSAFKIEQDGKEYVNLVTVDNTITVENEMRQKALIEDALLRAENANKAKTAFLSNMSHDIRTPMNAIIGFTTLAIAHMDDKKQVENYLKKIDSSGRHLLSLINNVLDMSRIESGRFQLEEKECDLADVMYEIEDMLMSEIRAKELDFRIDTDSLLNSKVLCDRLRLNQIFFNLIGNAIKFTAPGGSIHVQVMEKPDQGLEKIVYEFHVKDTGIGMSEDFQKNLFKPFERERNSTVSGIQGTGLGMSITKNIVDMMGGNITVISEKDVGTEFIIQIPMQKVSLEQNSPQTRETEKRPISRDSIRGQRVLLVEDNELNREIAGVMLSEAGLIVEEAQDGSIAVDKLLENRPGYYKAVLMDIQMPVMDGYMATQVIRTFKNKELASIPIIAMTANAFEEDRKKALETGMNAHIAKPIDVEKLLDTLAEILS